MEWIGRDGRFEDKVDQFFHRLETYGGAMHTGYRNAYSVLCPTEAEEFVRSQYQRFGIPVPEGAEFIYRYGVAAIVDLIDYVDPYLMFWDGSDISITSEWADYKYELVDTDGRTAHACGHDELETFRHNPGAAENFFNTHIMMPGFEALPQEVYTSINEYHNEVMAGERTLGNWNEEGTMDIQVIRLMNALANVCTLPNGFTDMTRIEAYFDLALWAGALWFFGPLGRDWRRQISVITDLCIMEGECILYQGDPYPVGTYRRVEALPGGCEECGLGAWCVEEVYLSAGWVVSACEHCTSKGMPSLGFGTCGKRVCRYTQCHHNPLHDAGVAGVYQAHRAAGQLTTKAKDRAIALGKVRDHGQVLLAKG